MAKHPIEVLVVKDLAAIYRRKNVENKADTDNNLKWIRQFESIYINDKNIALLVSELIE